MRPSTPHDNTMLALAGAAAFLGIASWFTPPPGALVLATAAIALGAHVMWKTRRSTR